MSIYVYNAHVTKVYDGDTITVDIDLGFGIIFRKQILRLYGINTPEVRGAEREEGLKSRDWLRERILDKDIIIKTYRDKKGKYGRWLGQIWDKEDDLMAFSINDELVNEGLAEFKDY